MAWLANMFTALCDNEDVAKIKYFVKFRKKVSKEEYLCGGIEISDIIRTNAKWLDSINKDYIVNDTLPFSTIQECNRVRFKTEAELKRDREVLNVNTCDEEQNFIYDLYKSYNLGSFYGTYPQLLCLLSDYKLVCLESQLDHYVICTESKGFNRGPKPICEIPSCLLTTAPLELSDVIDKLLCFRRYLWSFVSCAVSNDRKPTAEDDKEYKRWLFDVQNWEYAYLVTKLFLKEKEEMNNNNNGFKCNICIRKKFEGDDPFSGEIDRIYKTDLNSKSKSKNAAAAVACDPVSFTVKANKRVTVTFQDGTKISVVCQEGEVFNLETGLRECLLKKYSTTAVVCSKNVNTMVAWLIKDKKRQEDATKKAKEEAAAKKIAEEKKRKKQRIAYMRRVARRELEYAKIKAEEKKKIKAAEKKNLPASKKKVSSKKSKKK